MEGIRSMNLFTWLEPFVFCLLEDEVMPLCVGKITVKDFQNSELTYGMTATKNDTFTVHIPYAGSTLQWKVIFDGHTPEGIPDFLFSDPSAFDPDYEDVPGLIEWDFSDPSSLCRVIKDLIGKYKQHQLSLLAGVDGKLSQELLEVLGKEEFPNVDTWVLREGAIQNEKPNHTISILIQIKLNFGEIRDILFQDCPPEDPHFLFPVLLLRISSSNNKVVPLLYLSPRLEHALGGRNSMKLPQYYYQSMTVLKYSSTVLTNINSVFAILRDSHSKRREYMAAFLFQCTSSILEYDAEEFFKISLLFTFEDFYFIVHVTLGKYFPQEQPKIILQSVYHVSKRGALYQVTYSSYPYSPRWSGAEMVKRARAYITSQISGFKAECLNDGKI